MQKCSQMDRIQFPVIQLCTKNYLNTQFILLFLLVLCHKKIRTLSPLTVFLKYGQLDFSKASDSIFDHLTEIFLLALFLLESAIYQARMKISGWV